MPIERLNPLYRGVRDDIAHLGDSSGIERDCGDENKNRRFYESL